MTRTFLTTAIDSLEKVIIFSLDKNYCYTSFTNSHFETMKQIWGIEVKVGMNMLSILSQQKIDDYKKAKENFDRALAGERFSKIEEYGNETLTRSFWEDHYAPILSGAEIIGLVVMVIDISDRNSLTDAIKYSDERLSLAVKAAKIGIWEWDLVTQQAFWSDEILSIFNLDESFRHLSFTKYLEFVYPDDIEKLNAEIAKSIKEKSNYFCRHRVFIAKKELRWVEAMARLIVENDKPVKMIGTILDITDRMKMIEENQASSSLLQAAIESTADGILVVDTSGNISAYNKRFLSIYGFTEEETRDRPDKELIERAISKIVNPEKFYEKVKELYAQPEVESNDIINLVDGTILHRFSKPQKIGEKVVGRVWSFRDITEQNRAEELLLKSETLYRTLTTNMTDMVSLADTNGKFIYVSPSYKTVLGFENPDSLIGTSIFEMAHPDDVPFLEEKLKNGLQTKVAQKAEFRYKNAKGDYVWIETTGNPILNKENEINSIILTSRDVTERKKNEEELKHRDVLLSALANATRQLAIETDVWIGVSKAISILGDATRVDRIYIFQNTSSSPVQCQEICTWQNEILNSDAIQLLETNTYQGAESLYSRLSVNKSFKISVEDIQDPILKNALLKRKAKSVVILPINIKKIFWGFIGFEECKYDRTTTEAEFSIVKSFALTLGDILEKKEIEKENQDWKFRYEIIASSSGQIIYDYDITTGQVTWSQSIKDVLGYETNAIGNSEEWDSLIHPEDLERIKQELSTSQKSGSTYQIEYRFKKKNDEYINIFDRGFFLLDATQKAYRILGIMSDISNKKQAERALMESENRFRTLQEASFGGICLHDHGKILDANKGLSDITGYSYEELLAMNGYSLISADTLSIVKENVAINYEKPYDVIGIRKNGTRYNLEVQGRMIPHGSKMIRVTEFRDVTLRRQAEQQILVQNSKLTAIADDLKNKNQQLEEFTQIVSHNLRSPVSNILTLLDFYDKSNSNEERGSYIKMLRESGDKMLGSLHELNEVLKINQNKDIERQNLSFAKVLDNVKQQLSSQITKTGAVIKTDFEIAEILYPNIYLESILINLLSNALKYMHPDRAPKILFKTYASNEGITLTIKDNGLGIDLKKYSHQIFKLRKTFHKHAESRGIGLFMIKNQIEALGGDIHISSKENVGTEFIVNFNHLHKN